MKIIVTSPTNVLLNMVKNVLAGAKVQNVDLVAANTVDSTMASLADKAIVLLDWEFPDEKIPVQVIVNIKSKSPHTPILLLCSKQKAGNTFVAMKAGACGVVNKPIVPDELVRAIANAVKSTNEKKSSSVNVEFINPFIDATKNVLSVMCGVEITRKKLFLKDDYKMMGDVSGVMGLSGTASGSVVISMSKKLSCYFVGKMLGSSTADAELNAEVCDGVGEIINVIAGQAKSMLAKTKYHFNISIPSVVSGHGHEISHKKDTPNIVVLFAALDDEFALQVCLMSNEN